MGKKLAWRPTLSDVERISQGKAALHRGVGSRSVPHRLNQDERVAWELAKSKKYVELRGNGWRRNRGDSPLSNSYRNYCDALGIPYISLEKWADENASLSTCDKVEIDFSPLRLSNLAAICQQTVQCAQRFPSVSRVVVDETESIIPAASSAQEERKVPILPIWQLPPCSVEVFMTNRKEAKEYCKALSGMFCLPHQHW